MYILCKHMKIKTLVASLALQQIKRSRCGSKLIKLVQNIECNCKIQWYTILMLCLSILGLVLFIIIKSRKLKLFRGHLLSKTVKIMLLILDIKYYIPIKLCKMAGSIHLSKITGTLTSKNVILKRDKIWDIMEIEGRKSM